MTNFFARQSAAYVNQMKQSMAALLGVATWQGIRNEDLDVDMLNGCQLVCSKTGQVVRIAPAPYKD